MKLALGTAQFGTDYGAFNTRGQVASAEVAEILAAAEAAGIDTLDTARAYGASEDVLGQQRAGDRFRVVTKVRSLAHCADPIAALAQSLDESRRALGVARLDTVLFHAASDLLDADGERLWAAASEHQQRGDIGKLGVSVYDAEQALMIAKKFPIDVVQLPVNIFDQRALASGALDRLKARGIEVHARSVYLQGFALSDPDQLPAGLVRFRAELSDFHHFAQQQGISALEAATGFVIAQTCIDRLVVGVQSAIELREICAATSQDVDLSAAKELASSDLCLLNPALWHANGE